MELMPKLNWIFIWVYVVQVCYFRKAPVVGACAGSALLSSI